MTEALFQKRKLALALDTGSGQTILGPLFAKEFVGSVKSAGRRSSICLSGVSGSAEFETVRFSRISFRVGGARVVLRPAEVLLQATTPNCRWLAGRLGIDLLCQARCVNLDFHRMALTLE